MRRKGTTMNQPNGYTLVHYERAEYVRAAWRKGGGLEMVMPCGALATTLQASSEDREEVTCEACRVAMHGESAP